MLYVDSSALVKRYVAEAGSVAVASLLSSETICTSSLCYAEVVAALARKRRERQFSESEFDTTLQEFLFDWEHVVHEIVINREILESLPQLLRAHPLRGSDGIHLASALWAFRALRVSGDSYRFVVADERLAAAGSLCSLAILNPELT